MENKFNSRKQTLIISFLVFYIISVILSIHVFNIMALRNDSFNITDVEVLINEVKNSLINNYYFNKPNRYLDFPVIHYSH